MFVINQSCAFCGKSKDNVEMLVMATPSQTGICNKCVDVCVGIFSERREELAKNSPTIRIDRKYTPKEIKKFLDQHIVGQESAKMNLSVAVYNHYKRINQKVIKGDVEIQKSNVLLIGPTGTGKTYLAQTIAKLLDVPFAMTDATALTEAGYVGEDVESVLSTLYRNSGYDIQKTERGIIYIDEVDKISKKSENVSTTRDVGGEGVQQALLKIIEGSEVNIRPQGGRKHPGEEFVKINTSNILFICGGAFVGLDKIVSAEVLGEKKIGLLEPENKPKDVELLKRTNPHHLAKFGMIPEFVGRLPVITILEPLNEASLVQILTEPKNSLVKQYVRLLDQDGCKLTFTEEALKAVAKEALARGTGARGLRGVIEEAMLETMFEVPSESNIIECIINEETITKRIKPKFIKESA